MGYLSYQLEQTWSSAEDLASYLEKVAGDFRKMKGFATPPTELFLDVEILKDGSMDSISIRDL